MWRTPQSSICWVFNSYKCVFLWFCAGWNLIQLLLCRWWKGSRSPTVRYYRVHNGFFSEAFPGSVLAISDKLHSFFFKTYFLETQGDSIKSTQRPTAATLRPESSRRPRQPTPARNPLGDQQKSVRAERWRRVILHRIPECHQGQVEKKNKRKQTYPHFCLKTAPPPKENCHWKVNSTG